MNQFFKFLFASCLGTLLALGALLFMGIGALSNLVAAAGEQTKTPVKPNSVLELDLEAPIPEKTNNIPMDPFDMEQEYIVGLNDMVKTIAKAKEDPDIKGIYLHAKNIAAGKASASVLRAALADFKSGGKFIYAYGDYYTQNAYYVASIADSVLMNPVGVVEFKGFSSLIMFYKSMLDKLDVQMRVFYAGKFKGATEPYRLEKLSDENRLQIREYVNALYNIFIKDIAASRNIPEAELRAVAERFDGYDPEKAVQYRLIDRLAYEDEVTEAMKTRIGLDKSEKINRVKFADYYALKGKQSDFSAKDKIAVVYAEGTIMAGGGGEPGDIYDEEYVKLLRKARQDQRVKALVLRVNSPGGSVLASENILREVMLFKKEGKPVVVSMGDVAASGGYYIACQADSIFAEPNTITGSIGVFGAIPVLQKTMKENLGITVDSVRTAKFSAFGTAMYDFSPEESKLIQGMVDKTYDDFLRKVSIGRRMPKERVHEIAQGRVWAGLKAREIGLVDDIGGIDRALSAAAKLAGVEKYRISEYPRTQSGWQQFMDRFMKSGKDSDASVRAWLIRQELGDMYGAYKTLKDMRSNQGIQARLPYELIFN